MAGRTEDLCDLPNCIGPVDGTLFPLVFSPQTAGVPDCKGRKHVHTLSGIAICDNRCLVKCHNTGWPHSAHDNGTFHIEQIANSPNSHFDSNWCILGDSAFVKNGAVFQHSRCQHSNRLQ